MKRTQHIWICILVIVGTSCGRGEKSMTASSTGRSGEVLVVSDRDLWRGELKDTITNFFTAFQYGLPQTEPRFSIFAMPRDEFDRILRPHRSILMILVDPSMGATKVSFVKDKWASPQVVVKLSGPTRESLVQKFWEQREAIGDLFIDSEYRRYQKVACSMEETTLSKKLEEAFGFSMRFPKGFSISTMAEDFCWIRREENDFSQGVLVYHHDYTGSTMLNAECILRTRDSITRAHIPGPTEGSYMAVSHMVYSPESRVINFNGNYCVETRGLWMVKNDFMGGPFVNYTFVDKGSNRVIVLDGYVYAPRENKRDLLRSLEAILHSWEAVPKVGASKRPRG